MYEVQLDEGQAIPFAERGGYVPQRVRLEAAVNTLNAMPDYGVRKEEDIQYADSEHAPTPHEMLLAEATGRELPVETVRDILRTPAKVREAQRLIDEFDGKVVESAVQLRNYVTTRLVLESDHKDPNIRIKALTLLGKITDVGLFTEKTEINITNRTSEELEAKLKEKLKKFLVPQYPVQDATIRKVSLSDEVRNAKEAGVVYESEVAEEDTDD